MDTQPKKRGNRPFLADYRFNIADIVLIVLAMALLIGATWWAVGRTPEESPETVEITARLCVFKVPDKAEGKITLGETIYTSSGEALGRVARVAYLRPDGDTLRAYIDLTLEAQNLYNGYGVQCGEETLLLSLGESYEIHTKNYGGSARCILITENTR